jgi:hypothetical protein
MIRQYTNKHAPRDPESSPGMWSVNVSKLPLAANRTLVSGEVEATHMNRHLGSLLVEMTSFCAGSAALGRNSTPKTVASFSDEFT